VRLGIVLNEGVVATHQANHCTRVYSLMLYYVSLVMKMNSSKGMGVGAFHFSLMNTSVFPQDLHSMQYIVVKSKVHVWKSCCLEKLLF
jgi:hypothetical protein